MRVAVLCDVHGNLPALEAVLDELERDFHDQVVVGGDVCLGPMPVEALRLLRSLGSRVRFVRGNCDRQLGPAYTESDAEIWADRRRWCADRLDAGERAFLEGLPLVHTTDVEGLGRVVVCHATPRDDEEIVTSRTPDDVILDAIDGVPGEVIACGHTHVQFDRLVSGRRVVNAGSVGMPYAEAPGAYWATLGPDVLLRHTPYDVEAACCRIEATGCPGAAQFAAENVRSVPSGLEATRHFEQMAGRPG